MKKTAFALFTGLSTFATTTAALAHPALTVHAHPHGSEDQNSWMVIGGLALLSCCTILFARAYKAKKVKK